MSVMALLMVLVGALFAAFVVLNWAVVSAPTSLSLLVLSVEAPLGVVLLACVVLAVLGFATYALSLKARMLVEMRRLDRELRAQRDIADMAEASRIADLERRVISEASETRALIDALGRSLDGGEDTRFNGLYAHLGEIDDKLDRVISAAQSAPR